MLPCSHRHLLDEHGALRRPMVEPVEGLGEVLGVLARREHTALGIITLAVAGRPDEEPHLVRRAAHAPLAVVDLVAARSHVAAALADAALVADEGVVVEAERPAVFATAGALSLLGAAASALGGVVARPATAAGGVVSAPIIRQIAHAPIMRRIAHGVKCFGDETT